MAEPIGRGGRENPGKVYHVERDLLEFVLDYATSRHDREQAAVPKMPPIPPYPHPLKAPMRWLSPTCEALVAAADSVEWRTARQLALRAGLISEEQDVPTAIRTLLNDLVERSILTSCTKRGYLFNSTSTSTSTPTAPADPA